MLSQSFDAAFTAWGPGQIPIRSEEFGRGVTERWQMSSALQPSLASRVAWIVRPTLVESRLTQVAPQLAGRSCTPIPAQLAVGSTPVKHLHNYWLLYIGQHNYHLLVNNESDWFGKSRTTTLTRFTSKEIFWNCARTLLESGESRIFIHECLCTVRARLHDRKESAASLTLLSSWKSSDRCSVPHPTLVNMLLNVPSH